VTVLQPVILEQWFGGHPDGYEDNMFGLDAVRNLGQRVAEILLKIYG